MNYSDPAFNGERLDPVSGTYHLGNGYRAYSPVYLPRQLESFWRRGH